MDDQWWQYKADTGKINNGNGRPFSLSDPSIKRQGGKS